MVHIIYYPSRYNVLLGYSLTRAILRILLITKYWINRNPVIVTTKISESIKNIFEIIFVYILKALETCYISPNKQYCTRPLICCHTSLLKLFFLFLQHLLAFPSVSGVSGKSNTITLPIYCDKVHAPCRIQ